MFTKHTALSLMFLCSSTLYGVHANTIRYNNSCLTQEQRGNPDPVDAHIFTYKTPVNFAHVLATPTNLVEAHKEIIETWRDWALDLISKRLADLSAEIAATENNADDAVALAQAAYGRLESIYKYLSTVTYQDIGNDLILIPEQDIVLLMQWAQNIRVTGDELVPVVNVALSDTVSLTASSCCGDLPFVLNDHIYWQKVIEAGWVAVDGDSLGRVQPILHTRVIGDKFHFYKTKFGVFFRETLGNEERIPGDLLRIVKYLTLDPRHNEAIHGNAPIVWLKFPHDPQFNASLDGQYLPGLNRAPIASWVYVHDLGALFTELNDQSTNQA